MLDLGCGFYLCLIKAGIGVTQLSHRFGNNGIKRKCRANTAAKQRKSSQSHFASSTASSYFILMRNFYLQTEICG